MSASPSLVEALESRRLLSATVQAAADTLAHPAAIYVTPAVVTPSVIGTFTGTYNSAQTGRNRVTVQITTQTRRNVLYGTATVRVGSRYQYYALTGSVRGTSIVLTLTRNGLTVTVTGTVSANGRAITATFSATNGDRGTVSVSR